jgi:hypothetical protein
MMIQKAPLVFLSCLMFSAPGALVDASQTEQSAPEAAPPPVATQTPEKLEQLAAPIALYPDALVSQILAGATYPTEIVEADRWMQANPNLKGQDLGDAVDQQPWNPSIKALTQFPSVLADMDKNLSWASALGEAYANQPEAVMEAVQVMRARAQAAGNLQSNQQETVTTEGQTITIEPPDPQVVYVSAYDPWVVYVATPGVSFGVGFAIGLFTGFGWGWHHWGCDWHHRTVIFNHNTFISHSKTFYGGRGGFHDFGASRDYAGLHDGGFRGDGFYGGRTEHGSAVPHAQPGLHSGAFDGFDHGGATRGYSDRGRASLGGGGFHSGSFHGGRR